ncbi:MAG: hypothetical protein ACFFDW_13725 [Candidatus Thorarchaeota archaeon]
MSIFDFKKTDKILRRKILQLGNSPCSDETLLLVFFIKYQKKISPLNKYPYIFAHEWEVNPGYSNFGIGDLVLADANGKLLVIEIKSLPESKNRTSKRRKTRKRQKVRCQVSYYHSCLQVKYPFMNIESCYLTNDFIACNPILQKLFMKFKEEMISLWKQKIQLRE